MRRPLVIAAAILALVVVAWLFLLQPAERADRPPLILAAASMQGALDEAADRWAAEGHERPAISYAASSALARQVMAGATADLFISADQDWMDAVERAGEIRPTSRADLVANRMVLVAPRASEIELALIKGAPLAAALGDGRLAMADPDAVPAGRYGRAALVSLGLWETVEHRIARAENVRAALALVERGAAPLGIVYATDAAQSRTTRIVATVDPALHAPIRYPIARLARSESADAEPLRQFLLSEQTRSIFARHGFATP